MFAGLIHCTSDSAYATVSQEETAIKSLSGRALSDLKVLAPKDTPPQGCAVYAIQTDAVAYIEMAGHVDADEAIGSTEKRLQKANDAATKQKKVLGANGFAEKVSYSVLEEERKKLATAQAEIRNYKDSLQQLQQMKLSD